MGFVGVIAVLILSACVTGAPRLSEEQEEHVASITLFPIGQQPDRPYKILGVIESADCSGDPWHGRTYGNADRALDTLKRKAARLYADSVIEVSCGVPPYILNDCWAATKCSGKAIEYLKTT
jgi:hypothetical protein